MKKYYANKPCNFGGKDYYIGDEIPESAVLPERESALVKYGTISVVNVAKPEAPQMPAEPPENAGDEETTNEPPAAPDAGNEVPDAAQNGKDKKGQQGKKVS